MVKKDIFLFKPYFINIWKLAQALDLFCACNINKFSTGH